MTDPTIDTNLKVKQKLICDLPVFMDNYILELVGSGVTLKSQIGFLREIKKFIGFISNNNIKQYQEVQLKEITPFDILRYIGKYREAGNKDATLASKWARIKHYFDFLFAHDFIPQDVFKTLKKKKPSPEENDENIKSFTNIEVQNIFNKVYVNKSDMIALRDSAMIATLIYSGIRISELVALNVEDIDLETCQVHVVRKGGKKIQWVQCSTNWLPYIKSWLKYRKDTNIKSEALFNSGKSDRLLKSGVSNRMFKISGGNAHKFRKTFATALYRQTKDIELVKEALGHSNVETTLKYYIDIDRENINREISALSFE